DRSDALGPQGLVTVHGRTGSPIERSTKPRLARRPSRPVAPSELSRDHRISAHRHWRSAAEHSHPVPDPRAPRAERRLQIAPQHPWRIVVAESTREHSLQWVARAPDPAAPEASLGATPATGA